MAITEADIEGEVLEWFHGAWDPELPLLEWRERLVESGWAVPSWSTQWFGRGLPAWTDRIAHSTIRRAGGVAVPLGGGMGLAAPTMYDHANDALKEKYLRKTITGELTWCQLFSEPGAGSDLAGLRATATRDGDEWIVNGQKVWNTMAHQADMAILVARTDWDVAKHAGITYFLLDMRQPGVEVRQILEMNDHDSFNEVFLDDARIPAEDVVGEVGDGWRVARGTLAHERARSRRMRDVEFAPGASGRVIDEARAEAAEYQQDLRLVPPTERAAWISIDRARRRPPVAVDESGHPSGDDGGDRIRDAPRAGPPSGPRLRGNSGRPPGSEGSIGKLALSVIVAPEGQPRAFDDRRRRRAMLKDPPMTRSSAVIAEVLVSTPAQSIAGGTDEIQHNILGENVLGLPKEPDPNKGKPFKEVGT